MSGAGDPDQAVTAEEAMVKPAESGLKNFVAGGFGGICLVLVGQPWDFMKVRLQTSKAAEGAMTVAMRTIKKEGVRGLYRGVTAPLLGTTPIFATCFWGYDMGAKLIHKYKGTDPSTELSLLEKCYAGAFSAVPTTAIMAPVERIKCLLQLQDTANPKYKGLTDCGMQLYKEGGLRSVFRGWDVTLARDAPGSFFYFGVYEALKIQFKDSTGSVPAWGLLTAGGFAGMANWAVAIPADVIKSRWQTAPEGTYTGVGDVFRQLIKNDGPKALFRGFGPAMARAFPANAACFFGVDVAKKFLTSAGMD